MRQSNLMRAITGAAFAFFLFESPLKAQVPTAGNVFFGYSYYHRSASSNLNSESFNGWEGSLEGKVFPYVGIVADLTGHYGSQFLALPVAICAIGVVCGGNESAHVYQALFGPRVSVPVGRFQPFGEFEFGVGHMSIQNASSSTSFATAFGGGLDYRIVRAVALRFQADYVWTHFFGAHQDNARVSTGIVFRF